MAEQLLSGAGLEPFSPLVNNESTPAGIGSAAGRSFFVICIVVPFKKAGEPLSFFQMTSSQKNLLTLKLTKNILTIGSRFRSTLVVWIQVWAPAVKTMCQARILGRFGPIGPVSDFRRQVSPTLPLWVMTRDCGELTHF